MQHDCIFCKIAAKELPASAVYEDDHIIAFPDINPAAPVHILLIPKKHISNLLEADETDEPILGHIWATIPKIATANGLAADGFRVVTNIKEHGGQTVPHLHFHILGGRKLAWPPG